MRLACPLVAAALLAAPAAAEPALRETSNVRYWDDRAPRHALDVIAPRDAHKAPVVLFVHGGAWVIGDKNLFGFYRNVGRFFARHGYVAVLPNYRLSPKVRHPEHVKDIARAFAWARRHAAEYGGDPDRIVLAGHSAGAHLVALLAADETYLKDPELKLTAADRKAIRAVICASGVYDVPGPDAVLAWARDALARVVGRAGAALLLPGAPPWLRSSALLNPFRRVFGDDPEALKQASPQAHVRPGLPPMLILYATHELPMLAGQAERFGRALAEKGNDVAVRKVPKVDHNTEMLCVGRPGNPTGEILLDFLKRHVGGAGP
jgi:acetyl esterase/lipase